MTCIVRQTIELFRVPIYPPHSVKNDEKILCAAHIEKEAAERSFLFLFPFVYGSATLLFIL